MHSLLENGQEVLRTYLEQRKKILMGYLSCPMDLMPFIAEKIT